VVEQLQDVGVQAVSIHARTRNQMYKGHANWEWLGKIKNNQRIKIPIFGNGDVDSPQKAIEMRDHYGVDGVMIGRAAIGYPWIFREIKHYIKYGVELAPPSVDERVDAALEHLKRSIAWKGNHLGIIEMRRHYASYFKSLSNIKEYRMKLVTSDIFEELVSTLEEVRAKYNTIGIEA
jgi:tRNA-dihydrouridine synthase